MNNAIIPRQEESYSPCCFLRRSMIAAVLLLMAVEVQAQLVKIQEISATEEAEARKRAGLRMASYKWIKSDSSYFYIENYNRNGQIVSHGDSEAGLTVYDYNRFGKRVRACVTIVDKLDTVWEADYINDTLLNFVHRDQETDFTEDIIFDNLQREIRRYRKYRSSSRIDSIITSYTGDSRVEITYESGIPVLKIIENRTADYSIEEYFKFVAPGTAVHYLTWTSKFDKNGNQVSRVQKFKDRHEKTEYLTTYTDKGLETSSKVKINGKLSFEMANYYDKFDKLSRATYRDKDSKSETVYFYDEMDLELKSIVTTFNKGEKPEVQTYYCTYQFYADK